MIPAILCFVIWTAALVSGCTAVWWGHLLFFAGLALVAWGIRMERGQ